MKVKNKETGAVLEAVKKSDGSYTVGDKDYSKEEMGKQFTVVKAVPPKMEEIKMEVISQQEPIVGGENIPALFQALSKAQGQMEVGKKNVEGYGYQYMDMSQVIEISKKPLSDNGLSVIQMPSTFMIGEVLFTRVTTMISHKDGGYISSHFDSPVRESKKQALIQSIGTLVSYQSRYARNNILGISADKDTDGV